MKIILSVLLVIAFAGCLLFGIAFTGAQTETNKVKTQLLIKETELTGVQVELNDKTVELARVQQKLTDAETDLNQTVADLTAAETELSQTKYDLTDATHQLDTATLKNTMMTDEYDLFRNLINQKTGDSADSQIYVTPDDPAVAARARAIAGSYSTDSAEMWRDYKRMYDWVVNNITYNFDTPIPLLPSSLSSNDEIMWFAEYWQTPQETLQEGTGDCEDMANLLASLILSYNGQAHDVYLIEIQGYDSGHVAVGIPVTGGKLVILDPAGNYYSGYTQGYIQSTAVSSAMGTWLAYWSDDLPGATVTAVYSYDFNEEFSSTREYYNWSSARYD